MIKRVALNIIALFCLCAIPAGHVLAQVVVADAGNDTGTCPGGDPVSIGGSPAATGGTPPYTYSWSPTAGLDNPNIPNPTASPASPTTYTLLVTDSNGLTDMDQVVVSNYALPAANAGPDVTINEGQTITLHATGGVIYFWGPSYGLTYPSTANPDVEPTVTTTYIVGVIDEHGCASYDQVTVYVRPGDSLYFYNTFTPNSDGDNDTWYIGNIFKYPDNKLSIYNRYGKLVYVAAPYLNQWDGRNLGEELPAATYYYILDPGTGVKPFNGSVTIIR
jgi:gliding motility-associated-like protein